MMRILTVAFLLLLFVAVASGSARAQAVDIIEKTYCASGIDYSSIEEMKVSLENNAKRLVVNELFGEIFITSTSLEDATESLNLIQASSMRLLRVAGSTRYFNGEDFGEFCATIAAYLTDTDRARFEPAPITIRLCLADNDLSATALVAKVRREALLQALFAYDGRLEGQENDLLPTLVRRITYTAAGFLTDTATYCVTMSGYVTPIEVEVIATGVLAEAEAAATPALTATASVAATAQTPQVQTPQVQTPQVQTPQALAPEASTSTPAIAPTHTPAATPTLLPVMPATLLPTLIPTATPVCTTTGIFASTWQAYKAILGCAVSEVDLDVITVQPFEGGYLLWRKSSDILIALPANTQWSIHVNTWDGGDPFACEEARALGGPVMGFGKVWCENAALRLALGAPLGGEDPNEFAEVQSFANGQILETREGWHILLFQSGDWATTR